MRRFAIVAVLAAAWTGCGHPAAEPDAQQPSPGTAALPPSTRLAAPRSEASAATRTSMQRVMVLSAPDETDASRPPLEAPTATSSGLRGDALVAGPDDPAAVAEDATLELVEVSDSASGPSATSDAQPAAEYGAAGKKTPVDPVQANGPIFVDWPKPFLALVLSGQQNGYFEPCGCAGLENMKGGLARRYTFLKQLRDEGWPVAAFDLGNLVRRFGRQAEIKYHATVEALQTMGYDAIGYGPDDLRLPVGELLADAADERSRFVAANVGLLGLEAGIVPRWRIVQAGGLKIGVTAVLGKKLQVGLRSGDVQLLEPAAALREVVPALRARNCDLLVLLAHAPVDEASELARQFREFHLVVAAGDTTEPPLEPRAIEGTRTQLVELGTKGMYVGVLALFDEDGRRTFRYQRVPMDARFGDAPEMKLRLTAMQEQYRNQGWQGLGLRPVAHPRGTTFVGSARCGECHTQAYAVWEKTPHAHATETLARLDPPRQFDAECVSCHAVGWEPQKYFPFQGGFDSLQATPHLTGNGCENCHGPGSRHVAVEEGELTVSPQERQQLRAAMRLSLKEAEERTCLQCHDLDNSPDYIKHGFRAYWPKVEHRGKQ
jgi:hypothetical protein